MTHKLMQHNIAQCNLSTSYNIPMRYVRLAPDPVVDLCGGQRGKTTWDQVPSSAQPAFSEGG